MSWSLEKISKPQRSSGFLDLSKKQRQKQNQGISKTNYLCDQEIVQIYRTQACSYGQNGDESKL